MVPKFGKATVTLVGSTAHYRNRTDEVRQLCRASAWRKSRLAESPWCPSAILPPLLSFQAPNAGHGLLPEAEAQRTLETSSSMPLLDALDLA